MEGQYFVYGNQLRYFGNNISICLNGTGNICSKAELNNGKLLVYTEFGIDGYLAEEAERQGAGQIYFDCPSKAEKCAKGLYGIKLKDNIGGKVYKTGDGTVIKISSIGIAIESEKEIGKYKIEIEDKNNNKKIIYDKGKEKYNVISGTGQVSVKENDVFGKTDIPGSYSQRYLGFFGRKQRYLYVYRYNKAYDSSSIKQVYINGEKI